MFWMLCATDGHAKNFSVFIRPGAYLAKHNGRNAWVSIRGTELMGEGDFLGVKENLQTLVDGGKLIIDTSVAAGISLHAAAPVHRAAAV